MKRAILFFASCFAILSGFAQDRAVQIQVIQNDKIVIPQNGIVELEKKPFKIEIRLTNLEGVYLYSAFGDSIYRLKIDEPIPNFKDLPAMAMAETEFNTDQELIIKNESWSYWFYDKKMDWHRFDKNSIRQEGENTIGTKTIKQFFLPEEQIEKVLKIENVVTPLYLFFVAVEKDKKGNPAKELERYKLRINWR